MKKLLCMCLLFSLPGPYLAAQDDDAASVAVDPEASVAAKADALAPEQVEAQEPEVPEGILQAIRSETAEQAVEQATDEILKFIDQGKEYADQEPERFYAEVEAMLRPMIDFPRFARNVMGVYYRAADDEQRTRFAESFKWSLVRTYAMALTEFGGGEIEVLEPRRPHRDPDKVSVTMEIKRNGSTYGVVYMMQRGQERIWQLRNLVIEGVNIGLNFKSQFAAAMKDPANNRDLDTVIDAWAGLISDDAADGDDAAEPADDAAAGMPQP